MATTPTANQLYSILKQHPVFATLSPDTVRRYFSEQNSEIVSFGAREIAYSSSADRLRIGILLSGKARVETDTQALVKSLRIGELFGIANLFAEDEPFPTVILTTAEAKILFLDGETVRRLVEEEPTIRRAYLKFQSEKIVYLNRKIATLTAGSAEKRLAVFLLDYEHDGIFIPPCPMSRLAELLGIGRASLYRAIDALCAEGLIEKQGKTIYLRNKNALLRLI